MASMAEPVSSLIVLLLVVAVLLELQVLTLLAAVEVVLRRVSIWRWGLVASMAMPLAAAVSVSTPLAITRLAAADQRTLIFICHIILAFALSLAVAAI